MMYDTDQWSYTFDFIVGLLLLFYLFVFWWGGGMFVFPYGALCVFWWDCALHVYRLSYLG